MNKKIEYGILALLYLSEKDEPVASVHEMASKLTLPETLLSKIMQSMKNAQLVQAVYGNQGGYRLSRGLAEISLLDLTSALVGPVHVAECLEPGNHDCPARKTCSITTPMNQLNEKLIHLFQETSLDSLASPRKVAL